MKIEDTNKSGATTVAKTTASSKEFQIKPSVKAFQILSDKLYSNKPRAVIRELSCNAVDSHIAAGTPDLPIEVHIPTTKEPYFGVKDFGIGLNHDEVMTLYTTYFDSTKSDSNDFVGALGLGSKSPFAYKPKFAVIAIKDGMRRVYSAYLQDGLPCISRIMEAPTTEHNGVEVRVDVEQAHIQTFMNEAQYVYAFFKVKPKIVHGQLNIPKLTKSLTITPNVGILSTPYIEITDTTNVHWHRTNHIDLHFVAVQGGVAYPIDIPDFRSKYPEYAAFAEAGTIMEFAIGDLDVAPSREHLSYDQQTVNNILKRLEEAKDQIGITLGKELVNKSDWDKLCKIGELRGNKLYHSFIEKFKADNLTLWKKILNGNHHTHKMLSADIEKKYFLEIVEVSRRWSGADWKRNSAKNIYEAGTYKPLGSGYEIPVIEDTMFVLVDEKGSYMERTKQYLTTKKDWQGRVFLLIPTTKVDKTTAQTYAASFYQDIGLPSNIDKISAWPAVNKAVRTATKRNLDGVLRLAGGGWVDSTEADFNTVLKSGTVLYVELDNKTVSKGRYTTDLLVALREYDGLWHGTAYKKGTEIFGIRKSAMDLVNNEPNAIELSDFIDKRIATLFTQTNIDTLLAAYNTMLPDRSITNMLNHMTKNDQIIDADLQELARLHKLPNLGTSAIYDFMVSVNGIDKAVPKKDWAYLEAELTKKKNDVRDRSIAVMSKYPLIEAAHYLRCLSEIKFYLKQKGAIS